MGLLPDGATRDDGTDKDEENDTGTVRQEPIMEVS